jgi:acetylglutamate kinase
MQPLAERAQILVEALPYLRQYAGATLVIKYGGSAMTDPALRASVLRDVVLLRYVGMQPIVVHGGGPEISETMKRMGLTPQFVDGLRVTDEPTMEVAEMVLAGKTNSDLVGTINRQGGRAVGLSGKDADLLQARKRSEGGVDLGLVGEIERVNADIIHSLVSGGFLPVIAPIGFDAEGRTYNLNADHAAGAIAAALDAEKLIILTDVAGVLEDQADPDSLISELRASRARALITSGRIEAGMVPKVEACLRAVEGGAGRAHIINGSLPHALIMEVFTDRGIGTMVVRE